MELNAKFSTNPLDGYESVKRQYLRLVHLLGFKPVKKSYNVILDKKIDVRRYHKIMVQEKFMDVKFIEEFIIPGKLKTKEKEYDVFYIKNEREPNTNKMEIITKVELDIKEDENVKVIIEKRPEKEDPIKALGRKIFRVKKKDKE